MSSFKIGTIVGTGTLGVLAVGMVVSNMMKNGMEWVFGIALIIFVTAGAIALIAKSVK